MSARVALVAVDVPIDQSELEAIADAAKAGDWTAKLLHVVQPYVPAYGTEFGTYVAPGSMDTSDQTAQLELAVEQLGEAGVVADARVVIGPVVKTIIDTAQECGASLIVAISHDHNLVHRIFLGSALSSLLKASDRPVLVVPAPKDAQAPIETAIDRFFDVAERTTAPGDLHEVQAAAQAIRVDPESDQAKGALHEAVGKLVMTHPQLVKAANDISYYLSGMGI